MNPAQRDPRWRDHLGRRRFEMAAMESAGITVSPSPARLGKTLADLLRG